MDQGTPPHADNAVYNTYDVFDAYGTGMEDVGGGEGGDFTMLPWDHHDGGDFHGAGGNTFDATNKHMDFDTSHYGTEFQHHSGFEQDGQGTFAEYLNHGAMGVDDDDQTGGEGRYDMDSMDLYHAPSIYPNLNQHTEEYGIRSLLF